MQKVYELNQVI